ncbi:unnamed protein product [Parnassius mnemosyne]|uniref:Reverse transcriptase domain-containing protein n=1 Tax=Parnassius mnemosyne TaxID=213953 RepID=A0AAV1M5V3_9NEOP
MGETFPLQKGVKQDDPISRILFNAVLEKNFINMSWSNKGLRINGRYLNNLRFADDVIIVAETTEVLEHMLREFENKCRETGLEMNRQKCKIMTNGEHKRVRLGGTLLDYVEDFTCLG